MKCAACPLGKVNCDFALLRDLNAMQLLEVVRLKSDLDLYGSPSVPAGAVGTVVELLDESSVLVDFAHADGVSYAIIPVPVELLAPAQDAAS